MDNAQTFKLHCTFICNIEQLDFQLNGVLLSCVLVLLKFSLVNLQLATSDLQIGHGARRNSTLICAPVMGESVDQMLRQVRQAKELGADLVEIRLDYIKNFSPRQDLETLIKRSPLPTLVTYRQLLSLLIYHVVQ